MLAKIKRNNRVKNRSAVEAAAMMLKNDVPDGGSRTKHDIICKQHP
jgi:hypothetical protein